MAGKIICITGPESSGKSTLCNQLALHFTGVLVTEYAREFLQTTNGFYNQQSLQQIAEQQVANIIAAPKNEIVFVDTCAHTVRIWSEVKYNNTSVSLLNTTIQQPIDFYLLLQPNIPWQADPFREAENLKTRQQLYLHHLDFLQNENCGFAIIDQIQNLRVEQAIAAVQEFLKQ